MSIENFFSISLQSLNLFSFMLGMLYALYNVSFWTNMRKLWMMVILYVVCIAFYYYIKSLIILQP